jgi:hypothetical protein
MKNTKAAERVAGVVANGFVLGLALIVTFAMAYAVVQLVTGNIHSTTAFEF